MSLAAIPIKSVMRKVRIFWNPKIIYPKKAESEKESNRNDENVKTLSGIFRRDWTVGEKSSKIKIIIVFEINIIFKVNLDKATILLCWFFFKYSGINFVKTPWKPKRLSEDKIVARFTEV